MDNIYDRNTRYRVMTDDGYEHFATWHSAYKYAMHEHSNRLAKDPDHMGTIYIDKIVMIKTWEVDAVGEVDSTYTWNK